MALTGQQRKLARRLVRIGRRVGATPMEIKAALETGYVESGFTNLSGGDADSAGWRQERASLYKNPTNVRASAERFYSEARQRRGQYSSAGKLAAAVQRPAAQYRDRYGKASDVAEQILGGSQRPQSSNQVNTASGLALDPGQSQANISALVSSLQKPARPVSSAPPAPAFSARNALPMAGQTPISTSTVGSGSTSGPTLDTTLSAIRTQGQTLPTTIAAPGAAPGSANPPKSQKADRKLEEILSEANHIDAAEVPYLWGGGHGGKQIRGSKVTPLDCSGAVSRVLGVNPRVSGQFEAWGRAGKGRNITVYANSKHVLLEINGHFWGTSQTNPGGGAGWIKRSALSKSYLSQFTARHPRGL